MNAPRTPGILLPTAASTQTPAPSRTRIPFPPVAQGDWVLGDREAPVTVMLYCDYQLIACSNVYASALELMYAHAHDVRLVYRHYPLITFNDKSLLASTLAEAAGRLGRYWEVHDLLYERQRQWIQLSAEEFLDWAAGEMAVEREELDAALSDVELQNSILLSLQAAVEAGIGTAPTVFVAQHQLLLPPTLLNLEAVYRLEKLRQAQFEAYPEMRVDPQRSYLARLVFDRGEVLVQLHAGRSPLGVNSFVFLAEQGWYRQAGIHRVVPGTLIELGDPSGTGLGEVGYHFPLETDPRLNFDRQGMLALVSPSPGLSGGKFFINLKPLPEFNGTRTIIGEVISGMDLLHGLAGRDPMADLLEPFEAVLLEVRIEVENG